MKKVTIETYNFDELSEKSKIVATENNRDIHLENEWYDWLREDITAIGGTLDSFDTQSNYCKLIVDDIEKTIDLIIANHGDTTDSYKLAIDTKKQLKAFCDSNDIDDLGGVPMYSGLADTLGDIKDTFRKSLSKCYFKILNKEYEYLQTDGAVQECLISNDYRFTADGENFKY